MKIDKSFMQNAINRINELQQEIIDKSKTINGAENFVKEKLKLYEEDESLKRKLKLYEEDENLRKKLKRYEEDEELKKRAKEIHLKEQKITESFFAK